MHTHTCSGMLAHEHVHARTQTSRVAISQSIAAPAGRRYDLRTATHLRKTAYLPTWCMWHSQPFQRDMSSSEVTTKRYSSCDECTPSALRAHPAERLGPSRGCGCTANLGSCGRLLPESSAQTHAAAFAGTNLVVEPELLRNGNVD
jgi:hypothetical protein